MATQGVQMKIQGVQVPLLMKIPMKIKEFW